MAAGILVLSREAYPFLAFSTYSQRNRMRSVPRRYVATYGGNSVNESNNELLFELPSREGRPGRLHNMSFLACVIEVLQSTSPLKMR